LLCGGVVHTPTLQAGWYRDQRPTEKDPLCRAYVPEYE
jgi:hypothetical protein